jgi:cobalamin biosynthetic protein CobC
MVALAGAQAAIQMLPLVLAGRKVRVLSPTYNEHAACFAAAGCNVEEVTTPEALTGAEIAVVVNPNNPDGKIIPPADLIALKDQVGTLVVDESFADPLPEMSVAPLAGDPGLVVLRSFGKFYGLAGVRLGFAIGDTATIERLTAMAGPWPVAGPALEIGASALRDTAWAQATTRRLAREVERIDALALAHGWALAGDASLPPLRHAGCAGRSEPSGRPSHLEPHLSMVATLDKVGPAGHGGRVAAPCRRTGMTR